MSGVNNRHGLHFSAIAYQNSICKLRPVNLRWPITREAKKEEKKSININSPSAVVAKTDPISTSCSQPASTRITPALMHCTARTGVQASAPATSELSPTSAWMTTSPAHAVTTLLKAVAAFFDIYIFKKYMCTKALRQSEEQHRPNGGASLTLWPPWSCDRKINSSVVGDWALALRQVSLQSSEQR